jgi:hypothetical protein
MLFILNSQDHFLLSDREEIFFMFLLVSRHSWMKHIDMSQTLLCLYEPNTSAHDMGRLKGTYINKCGITNQFLCVAGTWIKKCAIECILLTSNFPNHMEAARTWSSNTSSSKSRRYVVYNSLQSQQEWHGYSKAHCICCSLLQQCDQDWGLLLGKVSSILTEPDSTVFVSILQTIPNIHYLTLAKISFLLQTDVKIYKLYIILNRIL